MNPARTGRRVTFDVIFGMIGPIVCLILDPGLYRPPIDWVGSFFEATGPQQKDFMLRCGEPQMGNSAAYFVYPAVGIGILGLLYCLILSHRLPQWGAFFSGIMGAGAVLAIAFGLPLIIFGLPAWLAAYVYGRNAKEAWHYADPANNKWMLILRALGGAVLYFSLAGIAYFLLRALLPPIGLLACPMHGN